MTEATKLRQGLNKVLIVGEVVEKEFEVREFNDKKTGEPYNAAIGSFTVRTGENETHTVKFFKKEFTKAGAVSKAFTGMQTAADRYVSVADIADKISKGLVQEDELTPTKVSIQGNLSLNEFFNDNDEHQKYNQINIDFISEIKDASKYSPKAEFDLEAIVQSVRPEMNGDDETGRLKLTVLVPNYGGAVVPFDLVAPEAGRDYFESNIERGSSVSLYGNIVNFRKVTIKKEEMGFGQDRETESYDYIQEYAIAGATLIDTDSPKAFDLSLLKAALAQREIFLEQKKTESKQPRNNTSNEARNGFGGGADTKKVETGVAGVDLGSFFDNI